MGELMGYKNVCNPSPMDFFQLDLEIPEDAQALKALEWREENLDYKPISFLSERVKTEFLDLSWKCEDPNFYAVLDNLLQKIPFKGNKKMEVKKRHLEGIIVFLYRQAGGQWVGFSRKKADYSKPREERCRHSRYEKITNYSYDYTITIVDYLHEHGFVEQEFGEWGRGRKDGNISRMRATPKLIKLFANVGVEEIFTERESVILRTEDKDSGKMLTVEYTDTHFTNTARNNLKSINMVLNRHSYSLHLPDSVPEETIRFLRERVPVVDLNDTYLSRKFVDDFESGGRFYGGFWQGLPNKVIPFRSRIRIDGEQCSEIDYANQHVAMGYNVFEKLAAPGGDLYYVPGFSNDKKCRKFAKQLLLRSFNVGSKAELRNSIAASVNAGELELPSEIWTVKYPSAFENDDYLMTEVKGYYSLDDAIDQVLAYHPNLFANTIYGKRGRMLQFLDSQLTEKILLRFAREDKACLPIHDSFVVKRSDQSFLKHVMESEYQKMFGFPIKVDIEF